MMPVFTDNGFKIVSSVEAGIVPDDGCVWPKFLAKHGCHAFVDQSCVCRSLKQHWREKILASPSRDQTCSGTTIVRHVLSKSLLPEQKITEIIWFSNNAVKALHAMQAVQNNG